MQIHIGRNGQQLGSFPVQEIRDGMAAGRFLSSDLAWHEGLPDWIPLGSLQALQSAPPPAVPTITSSQEPAASAPGPFKSVPSAPVAVPGVAPRTNPLAGWSLGLGLGSLLCGIFTAIPAVICGHMAISRINRSGGRETGRGLAITGLVAGYLMIAILPIMIALMVPTFAIVQEKAIEAKSMANARQIVVSCRQYAGDHDGRYPPDLETLVNEGVITDDTILRCPLLKDDTQIGYHYFGASMGNTDAGDKVILISKAANRKGERVVAFNDSSVEMKEAPAELPQSK